MSNLKWSKSIKGRLFAGICGLIVFFVLFSWILNIGYLETFYLSQKKHELNENFKRINAQYKGGAEEISLELEKVDRIRGMRIMILDQNLHVLFSTMRIINNMPEPEVRLPRDSAIPEKLNDIKSGKMITEIMTDRRLNTNFITLAGKLNNGDILIMSAPLAAIHESASVAGQFFIFTGILTIILGSIGAFWFSRRFTRPILELNQIAQSMAKLDFSLKYAGKETDELGELGKSINSLSDQLDKSISELRNANEKLQEDVERERRIDEMRKSFISNISHEMKTPLALVQGYAEGLRINVAEDEESKNYYCDVILDETSKMDKLVKELLDLTQMESGFFRLERTNFDLSELIDDVLDKYHPIFMEKDIRVLIKKPEELLVNGDEHRIEQVLVNYITNAINHIDSEKVIEVSAQIGADKTRISVFNTGRHIPEDAMDKIWTSFYKVDKARTRAYGGVGLGLSIVRSIMEHHLEAYGVSNEGNGVVFWFELPHKVHNKDT